MKRVHILEIIALILTFALMNSLVWGATSQLISYQGKLTDPNSLELNGDYILSFSIYNEETGADPLWTESQSARVVNGIYNVHLGAVEPLNAEIANYESLYLEVKNGNGNLYASGNIGIGTRTPGGRLDVGNGRLVVKDNGNVGIGTTDQFGDGEGILSLKNAETVPSTALIDSAALYASDGELYAYDSSGNTTQISPHDPETGEWIFFSKNVKTGRVVKINMEKLVKEMEKLTGKRFIEEWIE